MVVYWSGRVKRFKFEFGNECLGRKSGFLCGDLAEEVACRGGYTSAGDSRRRRCLRFGSRKEIEKPVAILEGEADQPGRGEFLVAPKSVDD